VSKLGLPVSVRSLCLALGLLLATATANAGVIGTMVKYNGLKSADIVRLPESRRQEWQDYLARSQAAHQADLATLAAERKGLATVPPQVGDSSHDRSMPLNRAADWYAGAEARHTADVVVSFQTPAGGWGKNQDFSKEPRLPGQMYVVTDKGAQENPQDVAGKVSDHWAFVGTIDNSATTTQLRFLAKVIAQAGSADSTAWRAGFLKGLDYFFAAEFPCGGWPQVWPLQGGYHDALTFNDDAFANTANLLADVASNADGLYGFVPPELKAKAAASVMRARALVLAAQVGVKGKRTIWGQQHDPLTLQPAAARNFEPSALSATESASLLVFLMRFDDPSADEIAAVHDGIAWLRSAAIMNKAWKEGPNGRTLVDEAGAGPIWARFYQGDPVMPVFGDRDKTIHDDVNDLIAERRNGYSWFNTGPAKALKRYQAWVKKHPL
jgi:PelA/Pel-15E family pectate lyase